MYLKDIVGRVEPAVQLLNEVYRAFGTPFILAIVNTTISLTAGLQVRAFHQRIHESHLVIQNVKKNKDECVQLMEHVHQVLYGVVNLHLNSETPGSLPPAALYDVGRFMEYVFRFAYTFMALLTLTRTVHKIHIFVESQQDGNKLKNFFRYSEMKTLLKECRAGMEHALQVFKVSLLSFQIQMFSKN
jgi:hypothetical protein